MLSTVHPISCKRQFRPRLRGCYAVKEQHEQSHQFAPSLAQRRDSGDVRAGAVQENSLALNLTPTLDAVHQQGATFQPALYAAQQEEAEQAVAVPHVTDASRSTQAAPPPNDAKATLREIATLSIPALGSVLADPICSLADTACVGQAGQSVQLAALSPCTAIFNLVFLVRPKPLLLQIYRFSGSVCCRQCDMDVRHSPGVGCIVRVECVVLTTTSCEVLTCGCCILDVRIPLHVSRYCVALVLKFGGWRSSSPQFTPHALCQLRVH